MGKTAKKILKVAAFVAIAAFAAPVAAAIGLSAVVGTVAGAALVGAAAGAATNGLLGGGVLKGALMGGIGGAIGGLGEVLSTPGASIFGDAANVGRNAAGSVISSGAETAASVLPEVAGATGDIIVTGSRLAPALISGGAATAGALGAGLATGLAAGAPSVATTQPTQQTPQEQAAQQTAQQQPAPQGEYVDPNGITVTGTVPAAPAAGLISPEVATVGTIAAGGAAGLASGGAQTTEQQPLERPATSMEGVGTEPLVQPGGASQMVAGATGGLTVPAVSAGGGFLSNLISNAPSRLLDTAIAVAPPLLASTIAGNKTSEVTQAQQDALNEQQQQYNNNFNLKTGYAQQLIDDADYYDPEGAGRRAAEAARIRAGLSARNAGRGMSRRRAETLRRQGEIEGGRDATRDYWSAYGTNAGARTQLRAAGINAIPLGSRPGTSDYESLYGRANDKVEGITGLINAGIGAWTGRNTGYDEVDDIKNKGFG